MVQRGIFSQFSEIIKSYFEEIYLKKFKQLVFGLEDKKVIFELALMLQL
jgi:hypothetical protein